MSRNIRGGIREAAKLLAGLDFANRIKVLEIIAQQDPQMAEELRKNMVVLEDLCYLTVKMMQELLQEIKLEDLGLALRIASPELRNHFLDNISKTMRQDLEEILNGPPQPVPKVQEAADKIMEIVKAKIEKGQIVLNKESSEEYV